ncbi:hypothetical protein JL721_2110 [Aureococcus anophagefferens]|nr:hypothetical protein JL721_2110 [Aureococcus anophagefferens]
MYDAEDGEGVKLDKKKAERLYRAAADRGDAHAQNNLGGFTLLLSLAALAINITTKKLADPYGHDLDDIHILSLCKLMPGACARILETSPPPRSAETTTTFVRSN